MLAVNMREYGNCEDIEAEACDRNGEQTDETE
jgi:hypothetical protein